MNFLDTKNPWRYIVSSNLNSSNAILRLIRQIYFLSIFPAIQYMFITLAYTWDYNLSLHMGLSLFTMGQGTYVIIT